MDPSSRASSASSAEGLAPIQGQWSIPECALRIHSTDIDISTRLDGDHGAVDFVGDIVNEFSESPCIN